MKAIFAIALRELGGYFTSVIGWIVLVAFTFLAGFFFTLMIGSVAMQAGMGPPPENLTEQIVQGLFGNLGVIAMLVMPAITMGVIAQDRRERSIELLLTSPITSWQIVLGKFLGGLIYAATLVLGTFYVPIFLFTLGTPDVGVFLSTYGAFLSVMAVFVAVGMFSSSLSDNQLIALVIGFSLNLLGWIIGWPKQFLEGGAGDAFEHMSLLNHFEQLSKGVIHTNDAVFFVSVIVFFLFATTQRVEALRWR